MFCGAVCGGCEDEYEQGTVLAVLAVLASECFDCTKLCEAPHHPRGAGPSLPPPRILVSPPSSLQSDWTTLSMKFHLKASFIYQADGSTNHV
jgi:hypothetical protein